MASRFGIDTSKWKPRHMKGTPAATFRNVLGFGIITFGIISGLIFHFTSVTEGLRNASEKLYEDSIVEVERRRMIAAGLPLMSSTEMRRMIEDAQRPDRPDI
ncbi:uncharacterized protein LOC126377427 [Pectinophora gossypiella]|nr:uncharacterized protein LOC126377427 [Pectinophora gossypiella]